MDRKQGYLRMKKTEKSYRKSQLQVDYIQWWEGEQWCSAGADEGKDYCDALRDDNGESVPANGSVFHMDETAETDRG